MVPLVGFPFGDLIHRDARLVQHMTTLVRYAGI